MYVTYDLARKTRSGGTATYPKVKRVYIAGEVQGSKLGTFSKRSGRQVRGVRIEYEQTRSRYHRQAFEAQRGDSHYQVAPASVSPASQHFVQIVEVPEDARNVRFHADLGSVPERYAHALQRVR
jgi:hypothetical protein